MKLIKSVLLIFIANIILTSMAIAEDNVDGVKSYKSMSLGFELEYPSSWAVGEENGSVSFRKLLKEENQVIYISFFLQKGINPNSLSSKEWYLEMENKLVEKGVKMPQMNVSYTSVGGVPAVLRETSRSLGENFTYFVAQKNKDILSISFYVSASAIANNEINNMISHIKINQ